jgi:hypothetical protein
MIERFQAVQDEADRNGDKSLVDAFIAEKQRLVFETLKVILRFTDAVLR